MIVLISKVGGDQGGCFSIFFLLSRCIEAALAHKKVDDVLNPDAVDREGVRDLIRGKKEVMM